jgi:hypothetical protein
MKKISILTIICMTLLTASAYAGGYRCMCMKNYCAEGFDEVNDTVKTATYGDVIKTDNSKLKYYLKSEEISKLQTAGMAYSKYKGWVCAKTN